MTNKASIVTDGWSGRRNINAQAQDDKIGEAMAAEHQHQSNRKFRLGKYLYRYVYIDTYFVGIVVVVVVVFVIEHGFRYCVCQYRIAHVLRSWRENVVLTPQFISVSSFKSFAWENYFLLPLSFCLTSTHRGAINRGCVSVYFHFAKNVYRTKGQHFSIITPDGIWFSRLVILFSCSNTFENVIFNSKRTTFESIMEEKLQKNCVCVSVSPSSIDLFLLVCLSLVNANKIIRNLEWISLQNGQYDERETKTEQIYQIITNWIRRMVSYRCRNDCSASTILKSCILFLFQLGISL